MGLVGPTVKGNVSVSQVKVTVDLNETRIFY